MFTVLMSVEKAVDSDSSASTDAMVRALPLLSNRSRTVSIAGDAVSVSSSSRKVSTPSSTRWAFQRPMMTRSCPRTAAANSSAGEREVGQWALMQLHDEE